jgi:hypothetical protein
MSGVNCHTKTGKSGNTGLVKSPEVLAKASRAREAVTSCCLLKQRGRAEEADAAHTVRKHHAVLRSAQRRTMRSKNAVSATGLPMLSSSRSAWKTQRVVGSSPIENKRIQANGRSSSIGSMLLLAYETTSRLERKGNGMPHSLPGRPARCYPIVSSRAKPTSMVT